MENKTPSAAEEGETTEDLACVGGDLTGKCGFSKVLKIRIVSGAVVESSWPKPAEYLNLRSRGVRSSVLKGLE